MTSTAPERYAEVKASPVAGNGVFVARDLPAGEHVLSTPRPDFAALDIARLEDTCSNCFLWTAASAINSRGDAADGVTVKACTGCKVLRYCSKDLWKQKCQSQSWKRSHKFECSVLGSVMSRKALPNIVRLAMQILQQRANGQLEDDAWEQFLKLEHHIDEIKAAGSERWQQVEVLSLGIKSFSLVQDQFDIPFVQEVFARVLVNSLTLVSPTFDPLGICLDIFAASINHSCDPNAFVVMDGPLMTVRSLKPIRNEEEIFISYIDCTNPFARRQHELRQRYYFSCACPKCTQGPTLGEDLFLLPPGKVDEQRNAAIDSLAEDSDLANDAANYVGDDATSRKLAALQAHVFRQLDEAQKTADPVEAVAKLEHGMSLCQKSRLWPVHRQPLPALRHELFVRMLVVGDFMKAFLQATKTYFLVDPVLFPQPHHPVRVVHRWTLAMLVLYISGEQDDPFVMRLQEMGLDLGVILYGLLLEVRANVSKSHGQSSTFARMVFRKVEEVAMDMRRGNPSQFAFIENGMEEQWKIFRKVVDLSAV